MDTVKPILKAEKVVEIRFSEVDSVNIVWHGAYALYFEDAREAFGAKYGLTYLNYFKEGYYAPIVELKFEYKRPLFYGHNARVEIKYRYTEAAKIVFDYEIYDLQDGQLVATGYSIQVFIDLDYRLVLNNPPFYENWKKQWNLSDN
ncbi:MAG: acyl-CoA thioesterase [Dysgonamonadaceae bacterium]|jgi:acyl-CoA thioester hydrolase|nr:acyl-CoA thioesterase [Dysgonamonadaceae bacterium]